MVHGLGMAVVGHDQGETLSRVVHGLGVADVEHSQDEQRLAPEEELRLWRMARREVSKKWDILKLCSGVLDENVGWETSERERMFSEKRMENYEWEDIEPEGEEKRGESKAPK